MIVIQDEDKDDVISIIMRTARSGEHGSFGDGKIFVLPVQEVFTISNGKNQL